MPCGFPLLMGIKCPDLHWNKQDKFKTWNFHDDFARTISEKAIFLKFIITSRWSVSNTMTAWHKYNVPAITSNGFLFFLQAFADSVEDAIHTIDQLTALHDKNTKLLGTLTKWQRTRVLKVVSILINDGILAQTDKSGKAKIYSYIEYLDILCKGS